MPPESGQATTCTQTHILSLQSKKGVGQCLNLKLFGKIVLVNLFIGNVTIKFTVVT